MPVAAFGRRFRSLTEARWAAFFEHAHVDWVYESETYDLGPLGWYLPDFYLPRMEWFLEVKPAREEVLDDDYDRARALHLLTLKPVVIANGFGPLPDPRDRQTSAGWIYDLIVFSDERGQLANQAGAGGGGGRLVPFSDGCVAVAHPVEWVGEWRWFHGSCGHGSTTSIEAAKDAYDAGLSFRPDRR